MNSLNNFAKTLDLYYVKLPALPKGVRNFIISLMPWLVLAFGILAVLGGIGTLGSLSNASSFAVIMGTQMYVFLAIASAVISLAQGVIELMSYSPLKAGKIRGWNLLFYCLLLGVVSSAITLNINVIISSIIWTLIGYYFLYQIKSYYK